MKNNVVFLSVALALGVCGQASAVDLLSNGNLDVTYQQEIIPGFFLPKPYQWTNEASRSISGAFEDEMSSEQWAGPSPTPVTTDGFNVDTNFDTDDDWAVFFKPFSGDGTHGATTAFLYQTVAATAGTSYTFSGWAGAEANAKMGDARFGVEFLDGGMNMIGSSSISLLPTLFTSNGQSFNYKKYSVNGMAPVGTAWVRARISMIDAMLNPAGGGQAFVVDDFTLEAAPVPEPATMAALGLGALALLKRRRAK